jgi:choline dehydrogenase-like flavoprotein
MKHKWRDPMPKLTHRRDAACEARYAATKQHIGNIFERMARNDNGEILRTNEGNYLDHPAGGCRMGSNPERSVGDRFGRMQDRENLFVVRMPTLTFVALMLRSAETIARDFGSGIETS